MSAKRKRPGAGGSARRSRARAGKTPRRRKRTPKSEPGPDRLAAELARDIAREARKSAGEVTDALDAELFGSFVLSVWKPGAGTIIGTDPEQVVGLRVVNALGRAGDAKALAVLRAFEAVGSEAIAQRSAATAAQLAKAGVAEPSWCGDLGTMAPRQALLMRDVVFDDGVNVVIEFERPGYDSYVVALYIDHNLGGIAKDAIVGPSLDDYRAAAVDAPEEVSGNGELVLEEMSLTDAAARCREALWRTESTLDPPLNEGFAEQFAAVAAHIRALPESAREYRPAEIDDATRQTALRGFLASPEAKALGDREDVEDLAMLAIDYCSDYVDGEGRPLRWSPVVVELFMTDYLPRKVLREPRFFERVVPKALPVWVRYGGRSRGIPEDAIEEAAGAVTMFKREMLSLVGDEASWGPAKSLLSAALDAGVDPSDQASMQAFIDEYNARLAA